MAGYFRDYYSDRRWRGARILGKSAVTIDQDRAQVRMRVDHHYVCKRHGRCARRSYHFHTRDLINLLLRNGRWLVAKEDVVLRATGLDKPDTEEVFYYPVGDTTTVAATADVPRPAFTCAGQSQRVEDPADDLDGQSPPTAAPWLDIRHIEVSSQGSHACVSLDLAAPPRPASSYMVSVSSKVPGGGRHTSVELHIDARGGLHPLLNGAGALGNPRFSRRLPRVGLIGNRLTFELTSRQGVAFHHPWLVGAVSDSLQNDEPLITQALDAEDLAPGPPGSSGCLRFPRGGISHGDVC